MNPRTEAIVLRMAGRFYCGFIGHRAQTAWSLSGATFFLDGPGSSLKKIEARLLKKGYKPSRQIVKIVNSDSEKEQTETVTLDEAKKLKRLGLPQSMTEYHYEKEPRCSVYAIDTGPIGFGFSAPTKEELIKLCGHMGIVIQCEVTISDLVDAIALKCKNEKSKIDTLLGLPF